MSEDIAGAALAWVQTDDGVRVEDYLAVIAALTGEAALLASGAIDLGTDLAPGAAVFGEAINGVLSGDGPEPAPRTVAGLLAAAGIPVDLEDLYGHVAASVGQADWGSVVLRVEPDHQLRVLPLQAAFELREAVDDATTSLPLAERHVPCVEALLFALGQVEGAIEPDVAVTIALEVTFAMAKTVPMTPKAFEAAADDA